MRTVDPIAALTRSLETLAILTEACCRIDRASQSRQDALAVQDLNWNALLGTERFSTTG